MRKAVWKYPLMAAGMQCMQLPKGAQILSAHSQETQTMNMVIYALVSPQESDTEVVEVRVYGTGHDIDVELAEWKFLDTIKFGNGELMFHVFYKWQKRGDKDD